MVEYIKREAAVAVCDEQYKECLRKGDFRGDTVAWDICADIKAIPAADVAPVVRCKGCKHKGWVQEPCHGKSVDYCKIWDCTLRNLEATFCSYGEQKDGGASNA